MNKKEWMDIQFEKKIIKDNITFGTESNQKPHWPNNIRKVSLRKKKRESNADNELGRKDDTFVKSVLNLRTYIWN